MNCNKMLIVIFGHQITKILFFLSAFPHEHSTIKCIHFKNANFDYLNNSGIRGRYSRQATSNKMLLFCLDKPHIRVTINSIFDGSKAFLCQ